MEKQKSNISPHNVLIYPLHSTSGAEIAGGKGKNEKKHAKTYRWSFTAGQYHYFGR
jgi:hypothetical protein